MRLYLIALFFGLALTPWAKASTFDWPSAACSGTLQACVTAAASGDEVQINTQAVIAENITISNKSLRLFARGTAARFGLGFGITITAQTPGNQIALENLWVRGLVLATIGSANAADAAQTLTVRGMRLEAASVAAAIAVNRASGSQSDYSVNISRNVIVSKVADAPAVYIRHDSNSGDPSLNVYDNDITSVFDGINMLIGAGRGIITGNRIGRSQSTPSSLAIYGIAVEGQGGFASTANLQIARNVVFNFSKSIVVNTYTAPLDTRIINNTVAFSTSNAIETTRLPPAAAAPPAHTVRIANNVISRATCGISFVGTSTSGSSNFNFFHNMSVSNTCDGASGGANDLSGTPVFRGRYDFRTKGNSPTVDVGSNADQPSVPIIIVAVPTPDFDSRSGRLNSTVDMGAFEFTNDQSFDHYSTPANSVANRSNIDSPPVGLFSSDILQIGQFGRDFDLTPSLPGNVGAHLGTWWDATRWTIFNQNPGGTIAALRRFFVLLNLDSNSNLLHVANATNTSFNTTTLDHPELNNKPNALPIVTQRWDPDGDGSGTYNDSAIGVWYDSSVSRWKIFNQTPAGGSALSINLGAAFNVMIPNALFAAGAHAFRTPPLGVPVGVLNIDHVLLNNNECAHPFVTASYNPNSVYVPSNLLLSYNPVGDGRGNWAIERGDGLQIPAGATFHVYVDPQRSRRCQEDQLLIDGFE
jgi:hypothetical protein